MNKKLLLGIGAAVLVVVAVIGVTYAYFTSDTSGFNVVTIGNVQIRADQENRVKYPEGLTTGEPFEVDGVVIRNVGRNSAYIRVRVVPENRTDRQFYDDIEMYDPKGSGSNSNLGGVTWDEGGDWYYYKQIINPGESITLRTTAQIKKGMADKIRQVNLFYEVEAIQSEHIGLGSNGYPNWPGVEIKEYKYKYR